MSYCVNCLEDFHDDDTGGYNPSCKCGARCRGCCEARCEEETDDWQDYEVRPGDTSDEFIEDAGGDASEGR